MTTGNFTRVDFVKQGNETETAGLSLVGAFTHSIFEIVNFIFVSGFIGLFGCASNITNMIVFFRMGLRSSVSNLNLFSLAIADLGVSIATFLHPVCFTLTTLNVNYLNWDPFDVFFITVFWPHAIFLMANRLITSFVAFERCVCVIFPFKVRTWLTTQRSIIVVAVIFAYSFISMTPIFVTHNLKYVQQDKTNMSKLVLVLSSEADFVYKIYMNTNFFALSFASVIFLFVVTIITSSGIKMSKNWRKSVSTTVKPDQKSSTHPLNPQSDDDQGMVDSNTSGRMSNERIDRETRLVKMIMLISTMYLVLYVQDFVIIVVRFIDKRISPLGQFWRLSNILHSFSTPITAINSSANIFFYYRMSTAYRQEFRKLFGILPNPQKYTL